MKSTLDINKKLAKTNNKEKNLITCKRNYVDPKFMWKVVKNFILQLVGQNTRMNNLDNYDTWKGSPLWRHNVARKLFLTDSINVMCVCVCVWTYIQEINKLILIYQIQNE